MQHVNMSVPQSDHNSTYEQWPYAAVSRSVIISLASIVIFLTVFGNISVILAFVKEKRLRTATNYPLLSLSTSDLLVGCITFPFSVVYKVTGHWYFGHVMCVVWLCSDYMATSTSVLSLCIVTFDRYMTITHFQRYKHDTRTVCIMVGLAWLTPALVYIPVTSLWHKLDQSYLIRPYQCDEGWNNFDLFTVPTTFMFTYMPLLALLFFNTQIYRMIKKNAKAIEKAEAAAAKHNNRMNRMESLRTKSRAVVAAVHVKKLVEQSNSVGLKSKTKLPPPVTQESKKIPEIQIEEPTVVTFNSALNSREDKEDCEDEEIFVDNSAGNVARPTAENSLSNSIPDNINEIGTRKRRIAQYWMALRRSYINNVRVIHKMHSLERKTNEKGQVNFCANGERIEEIDQSEHHETSPLNECDGKVQANDEPTENDPMVQETIKSKSIKERLLDKLAATRASPRLSSYGGSSSRSGSFLSTRPSIASNKSTSSIDETTNQEYTQQDSLNDENEKESLNDSFKEPYWSGMSNETRARQIRRHRRNMRIFKLIILLVCVYIFCWCPFSIYVLIISFCKSCTVPRLFKDLSVWLLYFNSCLNPILYVYRNNAFRTAILRLYCVSSNSPITPGTKR